jgi:hypothetical protein
VHRVQVDDQSPGMAGDAPDDADRLAPQALAVDAQRLSAPLS